MKDRLQDHQLKQNLEMWLIASETKVYIKLQTPLKLAGLAKKS